MYMILWYFIASHSHRIRAATCSLAYGLLWDANIMICAGNGIVFNLIQTASLYFVINYWLNYFSLATNDVCDSGDGGGPLVQGKSPDYRVVGLISHVIKCGDQLYPTAYTRLSPYSSWIESKGGPQIIPNGNDVYRSSDNTCTCDSPVYRCYWRCSSISVHGFHFKQRYIRSSLRWVHL